MTKLLLIAAGGALGALLRYAVSGMAYRVLGASFPWGTLAANLLGCFLIGLLWALSERAPFSPHSTAFVFTGILGAFTTFSTFSLETVNLLRDGQWLLGLANITASNLLGLGCVLIGFVLARALVLLSSGGAPP